VTHELTRALVKRDDVEGVWLVAGPARPEDPPAPPGEALTRVTVPSGGAFGLARRLAWEARRLPGLCAEVEADAVISMSGMLPRRVPRPLIVLPNNSLVFESGSPANRLRRLVTVRTARQADSVVVASEQMARLVRPHAGATVIPHGIDHDAFAPDSEPGSELLYVSDLYPHKHHELAIAAWGRLPQPRPLLRLVGSPDTDPALARRVARLGAEVDPERFVLERHSEAEMPGVYRRARVALMPSSRESFSLPMVEAAACGVPVVARDLSALRDSGGPGAVYLAGDDPGEWAAAIARLMSDDGAHTTARDASLAHAQGFSWERKAAAIVALLRDAPVEVAA
jgi:glycosyltransferase involved in cell wall biosynthesis